MAERTVAVNLVAKVAGYRAGLATAAQSTREFRGEIDAMRKKNAGDFHQMEMAVGGVGLAMLGLVGWATKVGMAFDKEMSEVRAITNATAEDMGQLREAALEAGKATVFSATEAAQAEAELAKAGLSTSDILGGALTGSLSLAAAGSIDLADAASIAAKTMGQFGLKGSDVGHIADLLAGAANASATDVHELGEALKMGGLAASAAGINLEDTTTVLSVFAQSALTGSDAGTSLKTMLMMLQSPTEKAKGAMEQYGLEVYDASGNMVDVYTLAERLKKSFGGLTQEQRNAAFATIFGADAMRSANVLYKQGADGLHKMNTEMLAQADANRVASQKTDNLAGDFERLKGSLEAMLITAQSGSTGPLRFLVQALDHLVSTFSALPSPVQQSILLLAGVSGAALLGAVAFIKVRNTVRDVVDNMRQAGPVTARFADNLSRFASFAWKATAALGALSVAAKALDDITQKDVDINSLNESLMRLGQTGQVSGELAALFGDKLQTLAGDANVAKAGVTGFARGVEKVLPPVEGLEHLFGSKSWNDAAEQFQAIDSSLAEMVRNGHVEEARAAYVRLMQAAQLTATEMEGLTPAYQKATTEAQKTADATDKQAAAAKAATENNKRLAGAFGEAASQADGLKNKFDELNGAFLNGVKAEDAAEQAIDDLAASFAKNGKTMDANTQKGRDNREAMVKVAETTRDAMQAKMDESGSVEESLASYQHYRKELIDTAMQAGYTRVEAEKLADAYLKIPSSISTTITATVQVKDKGYQDYRKGERQANGGVVNAFASGGEDHSAQIAPGGAWRMWAEPETGGEGYIPLAANKRARSTQVLSQIANRFGYNLQSGSGGGGQVDVMVVVKDTSGRTLRQELITDALNRNKPQAAIAAAYP